MAIELPGDSKAFLSIKAAALILGVSASTALGVAGFRVKAVEDRLEIFAKAQLINTGDIHAAREDALHAKLLSEQNNDFLRVLLSESGHHKLPPKPAVHAEEEGIPAITLDTEALP